MISRDVDIRCGWCKKDSKLGEWNDNTYSKCVNREMKRSFTLLTEERAFLKKSDTFYECPRCGKWSRGSQLQIVNTDDKRLLRLGGEPVMEVRNNKNKDAKAYRKDEFGNDIEIDKNEDK